MFAVEVANVQAVVRGHFGIAVYVSRDRGGFKTLLRTTTQSLIVLEADGVATIPTVRKRTWQGRASCSGRSGS